jgi:hypothetical protein
MKTEQEGCQRVRFLDGQGIYAPRRDINLLVASSFDVPDAGHLHTFLPNFFSNSP